ncbi:hypothetical protein [Cytobacillus gottheilii]|uniref:hypothetical protein n=1 Tax=Cytobacillus gottheilii TaxID=859144 RepID=UPI0009BB9BF5|nr:hypothetical protein [Cytobacillus gottheilii]
MLNARDKVQAERILKHLFIGTQVDGLQFGTSPSTLKLYFTNYKEIEDFGGQLYLNIESKWCLYENPPIKYPANEDEIKDYTEAEQYNRIYRIRRQKVTDVQLRETAPHLLLTLENGYTIFLNGSNEMYECWQAGVEDEEELWLVVAVPGEEIAIWVPDRFDF